MINIKEIIQKLKLNDKQAYAVYDDHDVTRVIAGPGTGKTTTLIAKIVYAATILKIKSYQILAITFSNSAAEEMRKRLKKYADVLQIDYDQYFKDVKIFTYHAYCFYWLTVNQKKIKNFQYQANFNVADENDCQFLINNLLETDIFYKKLNIYASPLSNFNIRKLIRLVYNYALNLKTDYEIQVPIDWEKDQNSFNEIFNIHHKEELYKILDQYAERYQYNLKQMNLLDFADLLNEVLNALKNNIYLQQKMQNRYRLILLDEFQDTTITQYQIIKHIFGQFTKLFIVGDPDQSIYAFRGTTPDIFTNIVKDFQTKEQLPYFQHKFNNSLKLPKITSIKLTDSYRTHQQLLNTFNNLIRHNSASDSIIISFAKKRLVSRLEKNGSKATLFEALNQDLEARWICNQIKEIAAKDNILYSDIAILSRYRKNIATIKKALINNGIPVLEWSQNLTYNSLPECSFIIDYLRLMCQKNNIFLVKIINIPKRGIGPATINKLLEQSENQSIINYIRDNNNQSLFSKKILEFLTVYNKLEKAFIKMVHEKKNLWKWINYLLETIDYQKYFNTLAKKRNQQNPEVGLKMIHNHIQGFKALLNSYIVKYQKDHPEDNYLKCINEFLHLISVSNIDDIELEEYKNKINSVQIMTIHRSKGLEFPYVFIPGLSNGMFPLYKTKSKDLEEERRVMYVAMSRTKKHLYLSRPEYYYPNQNEPLSKSTFIQNIGLNNLHHLKSEINQDLSNKTSFLRSKIDNFQATAGDKIYHTVFGHGYINYVDELDETITAEFDDEIKKLEINTDKWYII